MRVCDKLCIAFETFTETLCRLWTGRLITDLIALIVFES